jgi:hypothetical protein
MRSAADELLEKMRANPAAGWRLANVETVCRAYGVACDPPSGGGSHYKISHASQRNILTLPFRRPIKPIYVRKLVQFIDHVRSADERG